MKKYSIEVIEVLSRIVEVEAENEMDATEKVRRTDKSDEKSSLSVQLTNRAERMSENKRIRFIFLTKRIPLVIYCLTFQNISSANQQSLHHDVPRPLPSRERYRE